MKKVILSLAFVLIATTASNLYAINYPSYTRTSSSYQQAMGNVQDYQPTLYGGYSTVATGGTTTTGEGAMTAPSGLRSTNYNGGYSTIATGGTTTTGEGAMTAPSRPRRTNYNGGSMPQNPAVFDTWTVNGTTYSWNGSQWVDGFGSPLDPGTLGNDSPVGSPIMPMLLFALMAGGAIALRRRQAQA